MLVNVELNHCKLGKMKEEDERRRRRWTREKKRGVEKMGKKMGISFIWVLQNDEEKSSWLPKIVNNFTGRNLTYKIGKSFPFFSSPIYTGKQAKRLLEKVSNRYTPCITLEKHLLLSWEEDDERKSLLCLSLHLLSGRKRKKEGNFESKFLWWIC